MANTGQCHLRVAKQHFSFISTARYFYLHCTVYRFARTPLKCFINTYLLIYLLT